MTVHDDEGFEGVEFDTPIGSFRAGRAVREDDYKAARRHVRRRMGFFRHLSTFVTVMAGLLVIDIVTGPDKFWVQWVALVWGVILVVHFLNVFLFDALLGREAERRMIERELRKREGRG